MRTLIVGYGSIGKRHAAVLQSLNCAVSIVSSQFDVPFNCYKTIAEALLLESFDIVIIANQTHLHFDAILSLISNDFRGVVLVEKPIFDCDRTLPAHQFKELLVGYNLRFSHLLNEARERLSGNLIFFSAQVGQYLPAWRPKTDYRESYSAKSEHGGGVLRDLSHELDYCLWFCGPWRRVSAIGGHFSHLEIQSDDIFAVMMECERCPLVTIQMDYLQRTPSRKIILQTNDQTITVDLIKGDLAINGESILHVERDILDTYHRMHSALLSQQYNLFCRYDNAIESIHLIEKIEFANQTKSWVYV